MASKRRSDEGGEEQIAMDKSTAFTTSMEELMRGVLELIRRLVGGLLKLLHVHRATQKARVNGVQVALANGDCGEAFF